MALLIIKALTTLNNASGVQIRAELTDGRGDPVVGFDTLNSAIVAPSVTKTDSLGEAQLELTPNSDIEPSNTYYTITVGSKSFLIDKSGAAQTLRDAIVGGLPEEVGPLLTSDALLKGNNLSDLTDTTEARNNLGLGNSATRNIGTVFGTVAAGDDPRFVTSTNHNSLINRDVFPAHPADALEFTPTGGILSTNVQDAIFEVYAAATENLDEASEISFSPFGSVSSTNVQTAIQEVSADADAGLAHISDPTDAHDASSISMVINSPFTAADVQGTFDELFGIIAANPINRVGAGTGVDVATARVTGDPFARFIINAGGLLEWGSGAAVVDTNLYRDAANVLKTDDSFAIGGGLTQPTAAGGSLRLINTASIRWRNAANTADVIGVAVDTNDDTFLNANSGDQVHLALQGVPRVTMDSTKVAIKAATNTLIVSSDTNSTTAAGGIFFGSSLDTNLYRSAANVLTTDDAFTSGTSVSAPFVSLDGNPAATGVLRVPNDGKLTWRNFANSLDIQVLSVNTSNNTVLNATTGQSVQIAVNDTAQIQFAANTITLTDGVNYVLGTTTGTKFGSSAAAKLGLWGATPVVQPSTTGETAGYTQVGTSAGNGSLTSCTFTGNVGTKAYTISDIVKHLKNAGIIATS